MKRLLLICVVGVLLTACGKEASLFSKAQQLTAKKEYAKAIQVYSQIIKNNPQSYGAYANRGLAYEQLVPKNKEEAAKNRKLAERDYERAVALNYQRPEIFNNLAALYIDEERYAEALTMLNTALALRPNYELALLNRGVVQSQLGRFGAALTDFSRAEALNRNSPLLYLNRGLAEYAAGYYASAAEDFSNLAELQPQNPRAYVERGRCFIKMSYFQNAMDDFQVAMAARPDYAMPYYYAAELLFSRGDVDEALAYAQRAKALAPDYAGIYDMLGDMLALESPVEATQHYLAARRLDPAHEQRYKNKIRMMTSEEGRKRVVANRFIDLEKK